MSMLRPAYLAAASIVSFVVAACSASSPVNTPSDAGTGGTPSSTGGTHTGGGGSSGSGGMPASGGTVGMSGGSPGTGGSGGTDPIVQGCTELCTTILGAGCRNGPGLNACVQNCASAGSSCKAAQQCFACTGTAPRVVCDDGGVPQVPDCPECKDVSDRCSGIDASVDAGVDASDASSPSKDASVDSGGRESDAAPDARDARAEKTDAK